MNESTDTFNDANDFLRGDNHADEDLYREHPTFLDYRDVSWEDPTLYDARDFDQFDEYYRVDYEVNYVQDAEYLIRQHGQEEPRTMEEARQRVEGQMDDPRVIRLFRAIEVAAEDSDPDKASLFSPMGDEESRAYEIVEEETYWRGRHSCDDCGLDWPELEEIRVGARAAAARAMRRIYRCGRENLDKYDSIREVYMKGL